MESDESDAGSELGECGEDEESIGAESDTDEDEFDDTAEIDAAAALAVDVVGTRSLRPYALYLR